MNQYCNNLNTIDHPLKDIIIKEVKKKPILDIGCGNGYILSLLGNNSYGIDISKKAVKKCKRKRLNVIYSSISNYQPNIKFKSIIMIGILPFLKDIKSDFRKIISMLDKNGRIYLTIWNKNSIRNLFGLKRIKQNGWKPSKKEILSFFKEMDVKLIKSIECGRLGIFSDSILYVVKR